MALTIAGCKNTTTAPAAPAKSPDERAAELFPKPTLDIRTVGILLYDGYSTLDAMGRVFFVDLHKGPVENVNGMKVLVDTDDRLVVGFYDQCLHGAATHWYGKKILAEDFGAKVADKRYTHTGKYWTAAGITAGIDMSLALINEIKGENYTNAAMLDLEYDPQPPFKGGTDRNTDTAIVNAMRSMYDMGM